MVILIKYIIVIMLIIISAIFKSQKDTITFTPNLAWFQRKNTWLFKLWILKKWKFPLLLDWLSKWWISKRWKFPFLLKVPFSFLQNGWHFCDSLIILPTLLAISMLMGTWWYVFILYVLHGTTFEIFYKK